VQAARNDPAERGATGEAVDVTELVEAPLPLAADDNPPLEDAVAGGALPAPPPWPPAAEQAATRPSNPADSRVIHEPPRRVGAAAPLKSSSGGLVVVLMRLGLLANVLNTLSLTAAQHPVNPPKVLRPRTLRAGGMKAQTDPRLSGVLDEDVQW
jgi:hypothetical protein